MRRFVREWKVKRVSDQSSQNTDSQLIFSHWTKQYTISPHFSHFGAQVDEFGSTVLYTNRSRLEDAGLYSCVVEVKQKTIVYLAHVIILQHTPKCEFHRPNNEALIWMTCTVAYRGNIAPVLQWRRHKQGDTETAGKVVTEGIQANTVAGSTIGSTLTIVVNPYNDDCYYSCTVYIPFYNSSNSNDAETKFADNAPDFSYTWNSPVVKGQSPTDDGLTVYGDGRNSAGVTEASQSKNWFVISLALGAGMLVVFVLMTTITTVLCYRMKKRALEAEKRTAIKTEAKTEEVQDKFLSKEASSLQNNHDDYDVIPYEGYERICDVIQDDIALNMTSCAQSTGYGHLVPLKQRESSAYFKKSHQDNPDQGKHDLTGSEDLGQAYYLTIHDSEVDRVTPPDPASPYLALTRDYSPTADDSNAENRSSDYLKPC